MPSISKKQWWRIESLSASQLVQTLGSAVILGGVLYSALLWSLTTWADDRYVSKKGMIAAISTVHVHLMEDDIATLQDDIVFFDDEGARSSVRRYCRKLPRIVQNWEEQTNRRWEHDPIVQQACRK